MRALMVILAAATLAGCSSSVSGATSPEPSATAAAPATTALATQAPSADTVTPTPSPTATPTPMPTPPRPPVTPTAKPKESPTAGPVLTMFRASDVCSITSIKEEHTDGKLIYIEHFSCVRTASDPRFSGDVEFDVTTTFDPIGTPAALWEGTFTLTNDGGSWEGTGRGTVAIWEDIGLKNYGDVSYTGEGAYAGLTVRELLSATDQTGTSVGWIQE